MELSGTWRAAEADHALRRAYMAADFDDGGWETIPVPGHWRSTPAFSASDGPLLYRRQFDAPAPAVGKRAWLVLDGLFYQGDVWLDGAYVGDTEGYFFPHTFEVTEALRDRTEHSLALEVTCTPQTDRKAKRNITGVFQHWDCLDREWNPGGVWRPVRVEESGPVRIRRLRVLCGDADERQAVLIVRGVLDSDAALTATLHTTIDATDHEETHPLAEGENRVEWRVTVDRPRLWWPRALGDQALHDVRVEVTTDAGPSDARAVRTGLRRVHFRDWVLSINGERLFVKGANHGPTRMALSEVTADEVRRDVDLAVDAGLDLLRVHAHVGRPELYAAADEAGLLVWQDFPLQWGYARGIRKEAARQAREAVALLGHHPSIVVWCGHNEPMAVDLDPTLFESRRDLARMGLTTIVAMELPTWNRTILDRSVKRAFEKADGTRPVVAHSGVWPHPPQLDGTDSHLYFGWYHGDERDLPAFTARLPRMARFVSEFGAQAVPNDAAFCEPERWPDLDWETLGTRHCLQKPLFDRHVPPSEHATFDSWREATQRYQATLLKHHVEHLRRLKYRPTGGFCQFCFADALPAVTWSVLGHDRSPKIGFTALADACRPVIVVADRPPEVLRPGDALALDVHVVSDLRRPLDDVEVTARLCWKGTGETGAHTWRWRGDVPADSCVRVGTVQAVVPDVPGPLVLDLDLTGAATASNRYESRVEGD